MTSNESLVLNVKGAQHVLRPGIVLLGSSKNDRYRTILVDDKSICPKHASVRYDPTTSDLEVMDLCSVHGVTVDQQPIPALTWRKINTIRHILIGTVPVSFKTAASGNNAKDGSVAKKEDLSFLLEEDSNDFIDCSVEETQLLPGKKELKFASGHLSGSLGAGTSTAKHITPSPCRNSLAEADKTERPSSSFLVPATQQLEDSVISTVANESLPPVKPCVVSLISIDVKPVPEKAPAAAATDAADTAEDDDDFFFVPETQQPCEDKLVPSPTFDRIAPVVFSSERAERTQAEEEYFQMTVQDDENSNDGLFNNMYVEESQNLLQNMDESYKRVDAVAATRQSILPERSVDSISFQEHRNTTEDMSRLEWNESRQEHEQSHVGKTVSPGDRKEAETRAPLSSKEDDRSITPELHFNEPAKEYCEREGSATPEIDFDKVRAEAGPDPPDRAALEDVEEEDNEHEISLNQEGCNEQRPIEKVSKADGSKLVEDIYDIETQVLDFDREDSFAVEGDAKKPLTAAASANSGSSKEGSKADVCVYDMETQVLNLDDDGAGVAGEEDNSKKPPSAAAAVSTSSSKENSKANVCAYDMETQVLNFDDDGAGVPGEENDSKKSSSAAAATVSASASSSKKGSKADVCAYDMETQVLNFDDDGAQVANDPYGLLTQPMEPPKRSSLMGPPRTPLIGGSKSVTRHSKQPSPTVLDPDDLLTQPMIPPPPLRNLFTREKSTEPQPSTSSRPPLNLADVETEPMSPPPGRFSRGASSPAIDPADLLTQPMSPPKYLREDGFCASKSPASRSFDAYDQPTQLLSRSRASSTVDEKEDKWKAAMGSKKPFVKVVDIQRSRSSQECSPRVKEDETGNIYDQQTQPLAKMESISRMTVAGDVTSLEISRFEPQINSTVRYSQFGAPKQPQKEELEISPSSNKENNTDHRDGAELSGSEMEAESVEEDLDDEVCLAPTMPVGELEEKKHRPVVRVNGRSRKASPSVFKVPSAEGANLLVTPKPSPKDSRRPVELTEFLTPEHPLLSLPKPDSILMATGHMRKLAASQLRSKYHFNDSSSGSDDEDERPVFKKTNVSVAFERELEKAKGIPKQKKHVEQKVEKAVGKRPEKKLEPVAKKTEKDAQSKKDSKIGNERGGSSSSSRAEEPMKRSRSGKLQKADGKGKESSRGTEEKRREKETLNVSAETNHKQSDPERVVTRSGREVRQKRPIDALESESGRVVTRSGREGRQKQPIDTSESESERVVTRSGREGRQKQPIDTSESESERVVTRSGREVRPQLPINASIDYQAKSGKGIAPAVGATAPRSMRIRHTEEANRPAAPPGREERKARREEPAAPRRESKRQKAAGYRHRSPSSGEPPVKKKTDMTERPRRKSTSTKRKVDGESGSTTFGMLRGGSSLAADGCTGGLVNVSATSSSAGSDGSLRPARSNRPKLIFTRMSPEPYRKCIARAGGKVVDIPELANVLVTDRIFRTYKFLCAAAKGIPIVGQSYLDALQVANEYESVDPWEHILRDEVTEKRYKFRLRDTLLKARTHKLFQDYTVFVTSHTQPPPSELYLILSCAGATPLKHPGQSVRHGDKMFVISDPSDEASWPMYKEKFPSIEVVSTEGFMLSIMQHSINFKNHRLM